MRYLSMFSGIEAATVAWHPLGWEPAAFCEIDKFPSAVLAHHYPGVPNLGDVTKADFSAIGPIDLAVFGSPCQSFSVAGKRLGLEDPRGNLALYALGVVNRLRPRWFLFENVPGLLSSGGGRDFGAFLGTVGDIGYQCAWRVLDAQYFGVPQRRRRVFVVGHLGDWRRAAAVLFEPASLRGDSAPRREARERVARPIASCAPGGSGYRNDADTADNLIASTWETTTMVAHALRGEGHDASEDGTGRGTPLVPTVLNGRQDPIIYGDKSGHGADAESDLSPTLRAGAHSESHANAGVPPAICFDTTQVTSKANRSNPRAGETDHPLAAGAHAPAIAFDLRGREGGAMPESAGETAAMRAASGGSSRSYVAGSSVRRLTPVECERLMGFSDNYTLIEYRGKPAADGPRYKALGNSMAVPCMSWIGQRIANQEDSRT